MYAIILVGCALLLFAASILWYANRSVEITLNGESTTVRIGSTVERIISNKELDLRPGKLLAVDDSVLKKEGGTAYTVKLNNKKLSAKKIAALEIKGGEKLDISDGVDVYEKHEVKATEIAPKLTVKGQGPLRFVETWGEAGRTEVWTGRQTGKTVDKGMVKEPVDCVVTCTGINPDKDGNKYIALTFDECPSARTKEILAILKEKDVQATFFVSGDKANTYAAEIKAIAKSGDELGTNAMSDVNLTELSASDLRAQLSQSFKAVEQAGGKKVTLLRPPFGEFSAQNWADSMDLLSAVVSWNVDSGDWLLQGAQNVADTVVNSVRNGSIVLLTDNDATTNQTIEALPQIIDRLHEAGYTLVTLSDLIATDGDLKDLVVPNKSKMPKSASLPIVEKADDADGSAEG